MPLPRSDLLAVRHRCEYCMLPFAAGATAFHIDHVFAEQHDGDDALKNLALACRACNLHKGTNLTGVSIVGTRRRVIRIFNPRRDRWTDHFRFEGSVIVGITPKGVVTAKLLNMNEATRLEYREDLFVEGWKPFS